MHNCVQRSFTSVPVHTLFFFFFFWVTRQRRGLGATYLGPPELAPAASKSQIRPQDTTITFEIRYEGPKWWKYAFLLSWILLTIKTRLMYYSFWRTGISISRFPADTVTNGFKIVWRKGWIYRFWPAPPKQTPSKMVLIQFSCLFDGYEFRIKMSGVLFRTEFRLKLRILKSFNRVFLLEGRVLDKWSRIRARIFHFSVHNVGEIRNKL